MTLTLIHTETFKKVSFAGHEAPILAVALHPKLEYALSSSCDGSVKLCNKLVLEQIVTTIASVADTAEEKFQDYYDRFVPCLKYIIQNANSQELRLLRGKTIGNVYFKMALKHCSNTFSIKLM